MKRLLYTIVFVSLLTISAQASYSDSEIQKRWHDNHVYSNDLVLQELNEYAGQFPNITKLDTIGHSVEGRAIAMLTLGHGPHPMVVIGSVHAREYITTTLIMKDLEEMMAAFSQNRNFGEFNIAEILDNCTIYMVPMLNPDGVDIVLNGCGDRDSNFKKIPIANPKYGYRTWKANANGVDLNRNFSYGWIFYNTGFPTPCSERYKGPYPESEPETQAIVQLLDNVKPEIVLAYHTQGEAFYMTIPEPRYQKLADDLVAATGYEFRDSDEPYGSFQDHVDLNFPAFYACVELCPYIGPYPYPENNFRTVVWNKSAFVLPIAAAFLVNK